jgi:hypothetical protein
MYNTVYIQFLYKLYVYAGRYKNFTMCTINLWLSYGPAVHKQTSHQILPNQIIVFFTHCMYILAIKLHNIFRVYQITSHIRGKK